MLGGSCGIIAHCLNDFREEDFVLWSVLRRTWSVTSMPTMSEKACVVPCSVWMVAWMPYLLLLVLASSLVSVHVVKVGGTYF